MFRCHGNVSGRSIANTLHIICNRVLEEKRRAKERSSKSQKQGSDLLNAPVSSTARGGLLIGWFVKIRKLLRGGGYLNMFESTGTCHRPTKSHAFCVRHTHFGPFSRSHASKQNPHAFCNKLLGLFKFLNFIQNPSKIPLS